jgi:L-amino acid N-acyltransferase YncA
MKRASASARRRITHQHASLELHRKFGFREVGSAQPASPANG